MAPFSAFVLAAGFGTRLRPLTDEVPKPLLPVGGEPLLLRTLRVLHEAGARELYINVHHMRDEFSSALDGLSFEVQVLHEERILGTAGGLVAARAPLDQPLIVINGDIVTELPLGALLGRAGSGLTLAVARAEGPGGTVGVGEAGQVVRLRGELFGREVRSVDYIGVACLGAECRTTLPPEGCLIGDWALPRLRAGGSIDTVESPSSFRDLGDPESYLDVNLEWLAGRSHLGRGAQVEPEVELRSSAIGDRARVLGTGLVEDCVVLPGATAVAPLSRSIVLPSGRVVHVP